MNDDDATILPGTVPSIPPKATLHRPPGVEGRHAAVRAHIDRLALWQFTAIAWAAWLMMCLVLLGTPRDSNIGLTQIAESWGAIERVALWQNALSWLLPIYELPPRVIAYGIRLAFIVLYLLQAAAFWRALTTREPVLWKWMLGPLGAHLIMLLMAPSNSDVFFYAMIGDLAANGINPYLHELQQFPDHPLLPYQHWIDIGTVYGPVWVNFNALILKIVGPDPVKVIIAYKLVLGLIAIGLSLLVFWLARKITNSQSLAVAATVLVAWQPNMIFESSGQVHNDPLVMLLATAGLALAILGGIQALRGAIVLVALSFVTKFIALPLAGTLALVRLARPEDGRHDLRRLGRDWLLDTVAILAVILAAFLPYWNGYATIHEMLAEPSRLFAHPVWRVGEAVLQATSPNWAVDLYRSSLRIIMALVTLGIFVYVTVHLVRVLWRRASSGVLTILPGAEDSVVPWWTHPLLVAWTIILVTLSMLPVNAHPWYWTWAVTPVALLVTMELRDTEPQDRHSALPRWLKWYLIATALLTLMYHTRIAR